MEGLSIVSSGYMGRFNLCSVLKTFFSCFFFVDVADYLSQIGSISSQVLGTVFKV